MLLKLTGTDNQLVFINTKSIGFIKDLKDRPVHDSNTMISNHTSPVYDSDYVPAEAKTLISMQGGAPLYVKEHIAEILAYLEGRDPLPAKVLFGGDDDEK